MQARFRRREFVKASVLGAAGVVILKDSRSVAAYAANGKLNLALIGVCAQGEANMNGVAGENLIALCHACHEAVHQHRIEIGRDTLT